MRAKLKKDGKKQCIIKNTYLSDIQLDESKDKNEVMFTYSDQTYTKMQITC